MNSKRSSRKLWRLIDSFFLLLPLFVLFFVFIGFLLFYQKSGQLEVDNGSYYYIDVLNDFFNKLYNFDIYVANIFDYLFESDFAFSIKSFMWDFVSFFGFEANDNIIAWYLYYYFTYAICYEFFSFTIQIIMWLPRWAKNKLYEWGDN